MWPIDSKFYYHYCNSIMHNSFMILIFKWHLWLLWFFIIHWNKSNDILHYILIRIKSIVSIDWMNIQPLITSYLLPYVQTIFNLLTYRPFYRVKHHWDTTCWNVFCPNITNNKSGWLPQIDVILHQQKMKENRFLILLFEGNERVWNTHIYQKAMNRIYGKVHFLWNRLWGKMTSAILILNYLYEASYLML